MSKKQLRQDIEQLKTAEREQLQLLVTICEGLVELRATIAADGERSQAAFGSIKQLSSILTSLDKDVCAALDEESKIVNNLTIGVARMSEQLRTGRDLNRSIHLWGSLGGVGWVPYRIEIPRGETQVTWNAPKECNLRLWETAGCRLETIEVDGYRSHCHGTHGIIEITVAPDTDVVFTVSEADDNG